METFEGSIQVNDGGGAWLRSPPELGKGDGDRVTVTVERDAGERTVDVPEDLAAALAEAGVREAFDGLSYSHRREHVNAINDAKKPETRQRRIAKAVEMVTPS